MAYRQTDAVKARQAQTRQDIIAAATSLIHDAGYAGCTMTAVAERAGVATGTLYRFFPSKGELFAEVFRMTCAKEVAAASRGAAQHTASRDFEAALLAAAETFCTRALRAPRMAYALLAEPVDPLVEAERLSFRSSYTDLFATVVRAGIAVGQLPPQNPHLTGAAIVGAIGEALVYPLGHSSPAPEVIPDVLAFVRRALGAPHP
ncbi:TetR/AcrR family transcriptional regulator [Hoyosella altamirensis]|uniref:AcrR family transcriptional regulator n=1 Tax=Hoyosella altamirensis TaxID=616997 RepID=A0A839RJ25_9ACTN|nr:TetR/AcrR family transcriptional regulator [Hoyosella altamirensis]MBB3036021.1 AcrR family transcriptional regulator [Hoyosella altamirensis]